MDELFRNMMALLAITDTSFVRYLYPKIKWEDRMLALVGPRGVGKTTLLISILGCSPSARHPLS